jgi:hypothetical protein
VYSSFFSRDEKKKTQRTAVTPSTTTNEKPIAQMFAFRREKKAESTSTNYAVTRVAAGMFLFFTIIRATPWVLARLRA